GTWKFYEIDFNLNQATLTGITQIEFNGGATPFVNTKANKDISGALTATWIFSGTVAQTISTTDISAITSWQTGTASFNVTNTAASGLTIGGALTITGNVTVGTNAVLT